jgi:hypothetical protein
VNKKGNQQITALDDKEINRSGDQMDKRIVWFSSSCSPDHPITGSPDSLMTRSFRNGDLMRTLRNSLLISFCIAAVVVLLALSSLRLPQVSADSYSSHRFPAFSYILDNPILTIAGATITTSPTSTTGATTAHLTWVFGTVSGTYTGCTVQAKTSFDGATWLNLGSAAAVTVTTNAVNAWDIYQQAPVTTGVTTTTVSSTAAAGFGQLSEFTFACSAYGTSAPVTITAIYK